jgi:DNA-binding MarR family transcriptional regulator
MEPKSLLTQPTYEAAMIQSQAFRASSDFMSRQLRGYELSLSEWKLLGHLNEAESMTPSEISRLLSVKLPISSRLLRGLEAKKFLKRRQNSRDNRVFHATITAKGKVTVGEVETNLKHDMKQFLSDIDRKDLEVYLAVLSKIAAKVHSGA